MQSGSYSVRGFIDSDYEAVARINLIVTPEFPETAKDARRWSDLITREPGRLMRKLVVEEVGTGTTVAWGGLTHTLFNFHPDKYFVRVVVHPDHRGRGIGRDLYDRLEREAVSRGAVCLWGSAREDDPVSLGFLEQQGFVPQRKHWSSRLDLAKVDLAQLPDRSRPLADRGIRLTTFAAEGPERTEVRRRLYTLSRVSSEDAPRVGEYTPVSYEEFVAIDLEGPNVIPEAIFLASAGDEYVGWSTLQRVRGLPDSLDIGFTGTLPRFRGLGIASELKRRAVRYGREHGYRYILTGNDSLNPRIWKINEKLGFQKESVVVHGEKRLLPSGA